MASSEPVPSFGFPTFADRLNALYQPARAEGWIAYDGLIGTMFGIAPWREGIAQVYVQYDPSSPAIILDAHFKQDEIWQDQYGGTWRSPALGLEVEGNNLNAFLSDDDSVIPLSGGSVFKVNHLILGLDARPYPTRPQQAA